MGKKKATGMSKRLGFTDRATIAENKEILRYNERLEREAKGLPPDEPRRSRRPGRGEDGASRGRQRTSPPRPPRPPRPPALDDEQRAVMQAALDGAVGETGFEEAGGLLIERLAAHDSFDRASTAAWERIGGGHAAERTEAEWELLRKTWLALRLALLEAYVTVKPELEPTLARERKQLARLERPARGGRRRRPERERGVKSPARDGAGTHPARRAAPSPGDVARKLAASGHAPAAAETAPAETAPAETAPAETAPAETAPAETGDNQPGLF